MRDREKEGESWKGRKEDRGRKGREGGREGGTPSKGGKNRLSMTLKVLAGSELNKG